MCHISTLKHVFQVIKIFLDKKCYFRGFVISRTNCGDYLSWNYFTKKMEGFLTMCAQRFRNWLCLHKSAVCLQFFVWKWWKFVPFHGKSSISRNLLDFWLPTVWKLQKFSATQILREINFEDFSKWEFTNWRFYSFKGCEFCILANLSLQKC